MNERLAMSKQPLPVLISLNLGLEFPAQYLTSIQN